MTKKLSITRQFCLNCKSIVFMNEMTIKQYTSMGMDKQIKFEYMLDVKGLKSIFGVDKYASHRSIYLTVC